MVFHIHFLTSLNFSSEVKSNLESAFKNWRVNYRPPWTIVLHFLELLCVFVFAFLVIYPTIDGVYNIRYELTKLFFPEHEDNMPFSYIDEVSEYISTFLDNLEEFMKKSISNVYFDNINKPYTFNIHWNNGSTTDSFIVSLSSDFFQHISSFDLSTSFYTYSNDTDVIGCTKWDINVSIVKAIGGYSFEPSPKFQRHGCGSDFIDNDPQERKRISRKRKFVQRNVANFRNVYVRYDPNRRSTDKIIIKDILDHIKDGTLPDYVPPAKEKTSRIFHRQQLSLYPIIIKFGLIFLFLSIAGLYLNILTLYSLFQQHNHKLVTDGAYKELTTYEQFHVTIGLWNSFFLIKSILHLFLAVFLIYDSVSLSQFPMNSTMIMFGISGLFTTLCFLRWLMRWPKSYRVVYIMTKGFTRLVILAAGQLPILVSLLLAAVFLFGFVARIVESFVKLGEVIIAVIFGDSLYGTYSDLSDGSHNYNTLSFIYSTILVAVLIWIFFTSYTAVMTYVDHHFISQLVK